MSSERRLRPSGWDGLEGLEGFSDREREGADTPDEAVERAADREELMLQALRIAGVGAWELDLASQTLHWSNETFRIFGLEPGSQQPTNELFYSLVQEDDRERMLSRQSSSYETGGIFDEEYRIIRPDGETRYLNSRAQVVPRGRRRTNRFLGIVRDITERRTFEQRLEAQRATTDKLQADLIHISRVSAMDAMSSAMAHELNQPLTSITNYAAAVRRIAQTGGDPALLAEITGALQDSACRAAEIVRRLREMTTRGEVRKTLVSLSDCVREAAALALTGSSVDVDYDLPSDIHVQADRIQLQQVIINLVRNAVEAMPDPSTARIAIAAARDGGAIRMRVRDNGPGIADDVLPTIFESFVSTKPQGMGVGLAISRTIVESHGGRLTVETAAGKGTTFVITFPESETNTV